MMIHNVAQSHNSHASLIITSDNIPSPTTLKDFYAQQNISKYKSIRRDSHIETVTDSESANHIMEESSCVSLHVTMYIFHSF